MKHSIFNQLIKSKAIQTGDDLDCIGFECNKGAYSISFYADASDDYKVIVEDFGYKSTTGWNQLQPSVDQIKTMQEIINSQIIEIESNIKSNTEHDSDFDGCLYRFYGVKPQMFFSL